MRRGLEEKLRASKQAGQGQTESGKTKTTGVNLPEALHDRLKRVAAVRSSAGEGRLSVSGVIVDVLEQYLDEYEASLTSKQSGK